MQSAIKQPSSLFKSDAVQRLLAFSALIVLVVVFTLLSPNFLQPNNLISILVATSVVGVLAIGVTFVIITAGIDLSIGTVMTLSAVMTGKLVTDIGLPLPIGILGAVVTGGLMGLISGTLVARFKIPPFIATLGMLNVARGLALVIAELRPIYFPNNPELNDIVMDSAIGTVVPEFPIPNIGLIFLGTAIVAGFVLSKTVLGRYVFAVGSNEEATRLSGVRTMRWKASAYVVSGICAGIAGVMLAARLNSAQPSTGFGYELEAIAAAVIGGTSLSGGEGSILGTVIGAFLMGVLVNGLRLVDVPQEWQTVFIGAIVVFAVYLDIARRSRRG
jgi:ribose transport system permease protein